MNTAQKYTYGKNYVLSKYTHIENYNLWKYTYSKNYATAETYVLQTQSTLLPGFTPIDLIFATYADTLTIAEIVQWSGPGFEATFPIPVKITVK